MSSTNKPLSACPTIQPEVVEWLRGIYPAITETLHEDLRTLDHRSGSIHVINYLAAMAERK